MARGEVARAGPAPYSRGYNDWIKSRQASDVVPSGFKYTGRVKNPRGQILVDSADGNTYEVGGQQALDDIIGFAKRTAEFTDDYKLSGGRLGSVRSAGDFIDFAFNKSRSKMNVSVDCPEGGHLQRLDYAGRYQLLRATFANNGTQVVYSRVPSYVYSKLEKLALDKTMTTDTFDGEERTAVGVEFWNLVRIRGTRHGVRYPAYYPPGGNMNPGTSGAGSIGFFAEVAGARARKRSELPDGKGGVLSDESMKEISSNIYKPQEFLYRERRLTPDEVQEFERRAADLANRRGTVAYELTHGPEETRLERAQEKARKMVHDFLELPRISRTLRQDLLSEGRWQSTDGLGEGLLRQERFLTRLNMWPR